MKQERQTGFTLIELVVVIIILGILAAVALPKFLGLGGDARASVITGVAGSMRAANAEIYAQAAQTPGAMTAGPTALTINGATVNVAYGYAATLTDLEAVMSLHPKADFATSTSSVDMTNAYAPGTCSVTYTASTGVGVSPLYTLATSGC